MADEDTEVVKVGGGENDVIVIGKPLADGAGKHVETWLMAVLIFGEGLLAEQGIDPGSEVGSGCLDSTAWRSSERFYALGHDPIVRQICPARV